MNLNGYECGDASDWKYCRSQRNSNDSQRTETYVTTTIGTAKLRDGTVYLNPNYVKITKELKNIRRKLVTQLPIPSYSPFSQDTKKDSIRHTHEFEFPDE